MIKYLFYNQCLICQSYIKSRQVCGECYRALPRHNDIDIQRHSLSFRAPFGYSDQMANLIKKLKYQHKLYVLRFLADELSRQIAEIYSCTPKLIIPVPLHKKRLQQRGFNQSLEIAKHVKSRLDIRIDKHSLIRKKHTKPQAECTALQRQRNIKNAFELKHEISANKMILLDDVITTGSTVIECCKAIQKKQPEINIDVWAVCSSKSD